MCAGCRNFSVVVHLPRSLTSAFRTLWRCCLLATEPYRCFLPAGPEPYLKRARLMDTPSQTSERREQLDPTGGPLINNLRPNVDIAAGQLPELSHPVFGKAVELIGGGVEMDGDTIKTACELCCLGAKFYEDEVGMNFEWWSTQTFLCTQAVLLGCAGW